MSTSTPPAHDPWPDLSSAAIAATADHLHRLALIGGKYTLFAPFEPNWGNVPLRVTARGFATQTIWSGELPFEIRYDVLDDRVTIASSLGSASLPLQAGSVAAFFAAFSTEATRLGLPPLRTKLETEIPGAPPFDEDREQRPYDAGAARAIFAAYASAGRALSTWQASYAGQRPHVGVMWGGFDLAATRYRGVPGRPPEGKPTFQRNGMTQEVVAVGFDLGGHGGSAGFYAYISPPPAGFETASYGVPGASYRPEAGLVALPYDVVRASADPHATVVAFADAIYALAATGAAWPTDSRERREGWHASAHLLTTG